MNVCILLAIWIGLIGVGIIADEVVAIRKTVESWMRERKGVS